jgi:hypothetical protein
MEQSSALAMVAGLAAYRRRRAVAMRLSTAGVGALGFGALVALWGHASLYPCYDDNTLYNCDFFVGNDPVTTATALVGLSAIACGVAAVTLRVHRPTQRGSGAARL